MKTVLCLRRSAAGKRQHLEMRMEGQEEEHHFLLTTTPLRQTKEEGFSYVVEMVKDITEPWKAASELQRLNDFNGAIIDNAPVAIFTLDKHGVFTSVNPALASVSGLGEEAEEASRLQLAQESLYCACRPRRAYQAGLKGEAFELRDFPFNTYRGDRPHYIDFKGVPLRGKNGDMEGLLCLIEETTDRVNLGKVLEGPEHPPRGASPPHGCSGLLCRRECGNRRGEKGHFLGSGFKHARPYPR